MAGRIRFSLAQLEAFVSVVENGSLTRAAKQLGKDRTTLSELIDYLELDLGYALLDRASRPPRPSAAGLRLYRQARLFLQEAEAFGELADSVPAQLADELFLSYDSFVPRAFLRHLVDLMDALGVQLHLACQPRAAAEAALRAGHADLAIYQAASRSVGSDLKWCALGAIDMQFYAAHGYFAGHAPVTLKTLAARPQLLPFADMAPELARRLQISDNLRIANEMDMLRHLLCGGRGWAFLPTHFEAQSWENVAVLDTEMGARGLAHPVVAIWKPGNNARVALTGLFEQMHKAWAAGNSR